MLHIFQSGMGSQQQCCVQQNARCLRYDRLVFVKTLKAASTYFTAVFQSNGWRDIDFFEIDWQKDYVFGLIMDPVTRYIKALTEDSSDPGVRDIVESVLHRGQDQNCCILTTHALPLHLIFGDHIYQIDWIPLDGGLDITGIVQTKCKKHGVDLLWDDHSQRDHRSAFNKLNLYQDLKKKFHHGNGNFYAVFAKDIDLYNQVRSRYNDLYPKEFQHPTS